MNTATRFWEEYRSRAFGGEPLGVVQERECSLAFYAGIAAAFMLIKRIGEGNYSDQEGADILEQFEKDNKRAAMRANLDRATGLS
jgi:hypothetical protein